MVPVNFNIEGYVRSLQNDTVSISFIIVTHNSHLLFISHSCFGKAYVPPFAGSFCFPSIVPLVRKLSISFASNPSSLRISSLCSPSSGARFACYFSDAVHLNRTADRGF